jgi:hypothetical protein
MMERLKATWAGLNTNVKSLIIGAAGVMTARALVAAGVIDSAMLHDLTAIAAASVVAAFQRTFRPDDED